MKWTRKAGRFAISAASAVTAAVMAAGCSSPASTTSTPDPGGSPSATASGAAPTQAVATSSCGVISKAQAGAALGQAIRSVHVGKATAEGGTACVYYGPDVPAGTSPDIPVADTVRVVLVTGPEAKKYFDDYRGKVNSRQISGLGDAAFYDGYASISLLKGDAYVRIAVGVAHNLGPEKALARDALATM
jgi:hypothetical protein